ncbi:MAG: hypothetical protein J5821_03565 [Alphaproteobacteria bacterium]|nr:hypothetical protein [Alphaproteobacteria bacterium]
MKNRNMITVFLIICTLMMLMVSCTQAPRETEAFTNESKDSSSVGLNNGTSAMPGAKITADTIRFAKVSAEINDKKDKNVSTTELFDAFESVGQSNVVYIENGPSNWTYPDAAIQKLSDAEIVPLEYSYLNMPTVFRVSEELFPDKILKYHIWFDNECARGGAGHSSLTEDELQELRDANLIKLCELLQIDVEYEQTISGTTRVKSPELYLTKTELEEICHSGIAYLFYSLTPPDLQLLEMNHPDCLEDAKEFLYHNFTNYYWTYYHRTGEVAFNEELFQHVRTIANNEKEDDELSHRYLLMGEFLTDGQKLKYGESICTAGTPDGERWVRQLYEAKIAKYGDLIDKYIVDGEFLKEDLEKDLETIQERLDAIYSYAFDGAVFWETAAVK